MSVGWLTFNCWSCWRKLKSTRWSAHDRWLLTNKFQSGVMIMLAIPSIYQNNWLGMTFKRANDDMMREFRSLKEDVKLWCQNGKTIRKKVVLMNFPWKLIQMALKWADYVDVQLWRRAFMIIYGLLTMQLNSTFVMTSKPILDQSSWLDMTFQLLVEQFHVTPNDFDIKKTPSPS